MPSLFPGFGFNPIHSIEGVKEYSHIYRFERLGVRVLSETSAMCQVTIEIEAYQMPYFIQAVSAPVLSEPPKRHIQIL